MSRFASSLSLLAAFSLVAVAAFSGCAAAPEPSPGEPAFALKGSRLIGCCCGAPCPCRLNAKPMQRHGCDHTDVVHIESGHIGQTRMDGVTYATVGRGFGENAAETWVVVYLSDRASEAQEKALGEWLSEGVKALGPKANFLAGDFKGIRRVPLSYTVSSDKREYAAQIPAVLDLRTRAHINPGRAEPVVSTGIMDAFGERFIHADTIAHRYEDKELKYAWDLAGRQANWSEFALDSERVKQGGIGWGCWSAHTSLGDSGKYQEEMIHGDESVR
jgi:hypothetical protein